MLGTHVYEVADRVHVTLQRETAERRRVTDQLRQQSREHREERWSVRAVVVEETRDLVLVQDEQEALDSDLFNRVVVADDALHRHWSCGASPVATCSLRSFVTASTYE